MARSVVIIGAGVVGSALARVLADEGAEVVAIDRSSRDVLPGSTGHAPGFIGLYLEDEVHIDLAQRSAEMYDRYPQAFRRVGGLDVADTPAGAAALHARAERAREHGLDIERISVADAAALAPALVDPTRVIHAQRSRLDGAADARALVLALRADAVSRGARFRWGEPVTGIEQRGGRLVVRIGEDEMTADDVVLAGGLWGGGLAELAGVSLPLVPVGHPYVYSSGQQRQTNGPLVRFAQHGIYARVHDDRIGLGCYAHPVVDATSATTGVSAELDWMPDLFDPVVAAAVSVLPQASRFVPDLRLNGVFSMTPDGRPHLGSIAAVPGLWSAQAIWVTHAGGAAVELARMMRDGDDGLGPFAPGRFEGVSDERLRAQALHLY